MIGVVILAAVLNGQVVDHVADHFVDHFVDHGIAVDFSASAHAKEGQPAEFAFRLSDTASHAPVTSARPAAWLGLRRGPGGPKECTRQAATYLAGDLFARANVDLNNYFVIAMNDDASISVVDPLFGFGGSKLLAMVDLEGPGEDWALSPDQSMLYVSMPGANKVAVIDTRKWDVVKSIATGPHPRRIVLRDHLFVADDEGVTVIDTKSFAASRLRLGKVNDLAASDDFVFASTAGAVIVIDAHATKLTARVKVTGTPASLAYSTAATMVYAISGDRVVPVWGRKERAASASIPIQSGATQIRFAPNGRYALIANPERNVVQVLDAATNRIVQNAAISDSPDQITFTDLLAYVRRRGSETILTIPLEQLGAEGKNLSVADFPGGQHAYGDGLQSIADSIVPSPDGPSVLVANPADKMIYLYKEGMAAPAGGFSDYGRQPRAALVVDRGLRERKPGQYTTTVPVAKPGTYDVVFFLDAPRVVACFALTVEPDGSLPQPLRTRIAAVAPPQSLAAGEKTTLRFALVDPANGGKRRAADVRALAFEAPGIWQQRGDAKALANGTYEFAFIPPDSGTYYLYIESESLGLTSNSGQFLVYDAK